MAKIWKPTQAECNLIKKAAALESQPRVTVGQLRLEPGIRYNLDDHDREDINIALVSDDHDGWADTDLSQTWYWDTFRKGITLTESGKAIVDFYIRPKTDAIADKHQLDHLLGNVVVTFSAGGITGIYGTGIHGHNYLPQLLETE